MSRFNTKVTNKTVNLAGGKAFSMNAQLELVHAVLTSFLDDKYYESGSDRQTRIETLVIQNDPEFVAKLAYVARHEFNLRTTPIVLLGSLAKIRRLKWNFVPQVVERVDDLLEFASYIDCKLSKQSKRGIRRALYKFNRYQLAKYRGENKSVKLVDLFNLVHPNPKFATEEQQGAWKDLINGKLVSTDTWESKMTVEKDKKKVWEDLINENKLGYMAMIRNLNNLIKYGVSKECMQKASEFLANRDNVIRSKQLPFRFLIAYENVKGNRMFSDAISQAMDYALDNIPRLSGKTLIAVDSSGSMQGKAFNIASSFGAALTKSGMDIDFILYDTTVRPVTISTRTPVIDIITQLQSIYMGGGTDTGQVFEYGFAQFKNGIVYDRFIIISDQESWATGWGRGVQDVYNAYKKQTGTDPQVYAIDIEGYGTSDVTGGKVVKLVGWSERLLDFIGKSEGGESLVDYIKSINLNS